MVFAVGQKPFVVSRAHEELRKGFQEGNVDTIQVSK
jgi:hypothetical protein